jgi:hypothetical protein
MKSYLWEGWGEIPTPKFSLGDAVLASIDEPDPYWPNSDRPWLRHWCRGVVLGIWWGWGDDTPLSENRGAGWSYQILILETDSTGYYNILKEPVMVRFCEDELGHSTRARSLTSPPITVTSANVPALALALPPCSIAEPSGAI